MSYKRKLLKTPIIILIIVIAVAIILPFSVKTKRQRNFNKYLSLAESSMQDERYNDAIVYYTYALKYNNESEEVKNRIIYAKKNLDSKNAFDNGIKKSYNGEYMEAMEFFALVSTEDKERYEIAKKKMEQCKKSYIDRIIEEAKKEAQNSNYEVAIGKIDEVLRTDSLNQEALALKNEYTIIIQKIAEENAKKSSEEVNTVPDTENKQ